MKLRFLLPIFAMLMLVSLQACQDEDSPIGGSVSKGEVTIVIDSLTYDLHGRTSENNSYDSRSTNKLIGKLSVPGYGKLHCSFVSRFMSALTMDIPDSITINHVDSMTLVARIPRGSFTGDSLAPQLMKIFLLNKQLPDDIDNNFNPSGYYDPARPLGQKSYTLSAISSNDSVFKKTQVIDVRMRMPQEMAINTFNAYREDPTIFEWPQTFQKYFPGIYVEPSYGSGCIASVYNVLGYLHYHTRHKRKVTEVTEKGDTITEEKVINVKDSLALFSTAPEVLSSNNISFEISDDLKKKVAEGKKIITTPGGYGVEFTFPTKDILERYRKEESNLSVISDLTFNIPASPLANDYGIGVVPSLLMVKKNKMEEFFASNSIPDNVNTFTANYSSVTGKYSFSSLRNYILQYVNSDEQLKDEDSEFLLIPVTLMTETVRNEYTGASTTYVIRCLPYTGRPTLTEVHTDRANIVFTFTKQIID